MEWNEEEQRRLTELVREAMGDRADQPFQPFAVYEELMDRITVMIRDCSFTEVWTNGMLTMFEDHYPEESEDKHVGFAIEVAYAFCKHRGLPTERLELSKLLDEVLLEYPSLSNQVLVARQILEYLEKTTIDLVR